MLTEILKYQKVYKIVDLILTLLIIIMGLLIVFFSKKENTLAIENEPNEDAKLEIKPIKVDLKGEVVNPKVYELKENNTLGNLLELAKGLKNSSDLAKYNLAYLISDGEAINITKIKTSESSLKTTNATTGNNVNNSSSSSKSVKSKETIPQENNTNMASENSAKQEKQEEEKEEGPIIVNINIADANTLTKLKGIGLVKAQAIISYRNENGLFQSIEEIKNVKGIGDAIFEKIKAFIVI